MSVVLDALRILAALAHFRYPRAFSLPLRIFAALAHFRYPMRASSAAFRAAFRCHPRCLLRTAKMRKCAFSLPFWRIFAAFRYLPLVLSKRQRSKREGSERQRSSRFLCIGVSIVLSYSKFSEDWPLTQQILTILCIFYHY